MQLLPAGAVKFRGGVPAERTASMDAKRRSLMIALAATAVGTLYLGFLPARFLEWTTKAAVSVLL